MKPLYTKKNGTSQRVAAIEVTMPASYPASRITHESVSVTANGVKTLSTLLDELFALVDMSKVGPYTKLVFPDTAAIFSIFSVVQFTSSEIVLTTSFAWASATESVLRTFRMKSSGSQYYWARTNGTIGNGSSNVIDNGLVITLYY